MADLIITYRTKKLEKTFNDDKRMVKEYGPEQAREIRHRMRVLAVAANLSEVPIRPPVRRHQLTGNRDEQFAVDLKHPYRLIFAPNHEPIPRKADGGIDLEVITAIQILGVEDYHR